jgi:two-component sensor histidine kinase
MESAGSGGASAFAGELLHDAPCGIAVTDPDGALLYANATLAHWLGLPGDRPLPARHLPELFTPPGRTYYETHLAPTMMLQGFVREISCTLQLNGSEPVPVLLSGELRRDPEGRPLRCDYTIFDARERTSCERQLREARREADELAAIVRSSPDAILRVDGHGIVTRWNAGAERLLEHPAEAALARPVAELVPLGARGDWFAAALASGRPVVSFTRAHASGREFEVTIARIGESAAPFAGGFRSPDRPEWPAWPDWTVTLRDVTARRRAERHLKVVASEMRHRVKNMLAVVSSIARQTLREAQAEPFMDRLRALAMAQDVLTRSDRPHVRLRDLLELATQEAGQEVGQDRVHLDGGTVWLNPEQVTSLSMTFHELVSNALKYGALSRPAGAVTVRWRCEGAPGARRMQLCWTESGGPPVTPPRRAGFGTRMIGRVLTAELDSEVRFDFDRAGLRCRLAMPVAEGPNPPPPPD